MKISINKDRFMFYVWVGLAYFLLWEFSNINKYPETLFVRTVNEFWRAVYIIIINFIFFEYTLPFIRRKRKNIFLRILLSLLVLWAQLMLYSFGLYAWRYFGIQMLFYIPLRTDPSITEGVAYHFPYSVGSVFFFAIIKHIYDFIKLRQAAQQLRIEKQQAELSYLKSQTNPHFLFNTLNNIYSLARDKSDLAPESILRLSKILRFMLYEADGDYIPVEMELKVISDYIALEKLRYDNSLHVNLDYEIPDKTLQLPPLLLIPLVENAFKHGVSETRDQPFIDIHLSGDHRQVKFIVKNSTENSPDDGSVKENIGLTNLRRQLQLLYTDYELSVQQSESVFTASLIINLRSHV